MLKKTVIFVATTFISTTVFAQQPKLSARQQARWQHLQRLSNLDHDRMMQRLGIDSLRRGYDGGKNTIHPPNIDEAKANPYPVLPDPLLANSGRRITTPAQWWKYRRQEILQAFDSCIYGNLPTHIPAVRWQLVKADTLQKGNIPIVVKTLVGHLDNRQDTAIHVNIELTLTLPAKAVKPVAVMMDFGFRLPPGFHMPHALQDSTPDWKELVLEKGWGYAVLYPESIQADNGAGLAKGIIGLCNRGQPRQPEDWGALRAWAWGASRALDYLETDPAVNAKEVGIEGLSRYGKAALVTMAYDRRFAIALIGSSGKGGATLWRRNFGEGMGNLAGAGEYHWFCGNLLRFDGPLTANDLPVDAHELIALCAPRPVFISTGSPQVEGNWVDDKGQFMAEVAAGPVYRLLGKKGLGVRVMPAMGTLLDSGELAFRQHFGGHTDGPNWPYFLLFAGRYFQ